MAVCEVGAVDVFEMWTVEENLQQDDCVTM